MSAIGVYLPDSTKDALIESGVKLSMLDSRMYNLYIEDTDKCIKRGGYYYYWIREKVYVSNPDDSILHILNPWNEENLGIWRDIFNNVPHRFSI